MHTLVRFHMKPDWVPLGSRQLERQALVVFYPQEPAVELVGPGHFLTHMVLMFYA
jgi:hypothetical protein